MRLDPITLIQNQSRFESPKLCQSSNSKLRAIKYADSLPYNGSTRLYEFAGLAPPTKASQLQVKPDDHSEVVPLLPIPNRTVKRLSADDSADSRVKVGHRQAINLKPPSRLLVGGFAFGETLFPHAHYCNSTAFEVR